MHACARERECVRQDWSNLDHLTKWFNLDHSTKWSNCDHLTSSWSNLGFDDGQFGPHLVDHQFATVNFGARAQGALAAFHHWRCWERASCRLDPGGRSDDDQNAEAHRGHARRAVRHPRQVRRHSSLRHAASYFRHCFLWPRYPCRAVTNRELR